MADLRTTHFALLALPFAAACASAPDGDSAAVVGTVPSPGAQAGAGEASADAGIEAAIAALRGGDLGRARELVDGLTFERALSRARSRVAAGSPLDAVPAFDEALAVRPDAADAQLERARALFDAAAADAARADLYAEAAAGFEAAERLGAGPVAALYGARSLYMIGDAQGALRLARAALGSGAQSAGLPLPAERIWGDAAFGAYTAARSAGSSEAAALYAECEDAFGRLAAVAPRDPYPLQQLANLALWEGRRSDALRHLSGALPLAPRDEALHNTYVETLRAEAYAAAWRAADGPSEAPAEDAPEAERAAFQALTATALRAQRDAVLAAYSQLASADPSNPLVHWYAASERFQRALEAYAAGTLEPAEFEHAERDYRRCRELDASYAETCRGWEVIARTGRGWCHHWAGALDAAEEAFWSTEELLEGGLDWQYEGRLASALVGLAAVAGAHAAKTEDLAAQSKAAALGDALFARRPSDGNLANNAGFLNRDAGIACELAARRLRGEATRAESGERRDALRAEATALRARAQQHMERSWAAYQVAAELLPDDVRVVNDTGLVMAYYLRTDRPAAERYFRRAIELAHTQLADYAARGEAPPEDLLVAFGDAHQNLGTLALTFDNDLVSARDWFVKACEVAPDDRPEVDQILPELAASIAAGAWTDDLRAFERMLVWKD